MARQNIRVLRGIKTVEEALDTETFPADKQSLNYAVGDVEIEDGFGGWIPVRDALDRVDDESFDSAEEAINAIRNALSRMPKKSAA